MQFGDFHSDAAVRRKVAIQRASYSVSLEHIYTSWLCSLLKSG